MNKELFLRELSKKETVIEKVFLARETIQENKSEEVVREAERFLEDTKTSSVFLIKQIKKGNEQAFEQLLEVKDIRNFIHYYSYQINQYHQFQYKVDTIINEIKYQIFYHVKKNYRIYYEPHEFSLLINSMRRWIKQKVSNVLKVDSRPKIDFHLDEKYLEDTYYDDTDVIVNKLVEACLSEDEKEIFELRFYRHMTYTEMAAVMSKSKDTMQRRYVEILEKLKTNILKEA